MVRTVVFDVGETLFDETRSWERAADAAGVPRFTLLGMVGWLGARGERLSRIWEVLGVEPGDWGGFTADELYPDARPALDELRCDPGEIAYVGDRVDNDVGPARAAGLVAVHIRRGPWGYLQEGRERAHLRIDSLAELPGALRGV